jgi:hypothetical protein
MASPFPGMDPYLENTDFWEGFHNGFMHYVQEDLQPRLPENYVATLEMRIYFQPEGETLAARTQRVPDLELVRTGPSPVRPATPDRPEARGTVRELDLGRVFERTYITGAFHRLLNYTGEPDPPLAPEDAAWAASDAGRGIPMRMGSAP